MKQTFFDYIGTADMERVHSATIAWMISDQCNAFNCEERISLLNSLFGTTKDDIKSIDVCTEFEHIDIAFTTEDYSGNKDIWVIENKVKAPLGYNQLKKYEHIIISDESVESKGDKHKPTEREKEYAYARRKYKETHFAVLSLIGILPQDEVGKWHCATYAKLLYSLNLILNKKDNASQHFAIIKEYRDCLYNLDYVLKEFDKRPEKYPNVFTDGSKRNSEKINKDTGSLVGNYISKNGLETLLQKCYFVDIVNKISTAIEYKWCHVSETHGNADFAFHFGDMGTGSYRFDLSFQNGTFKFAVTDEKYTNLPKPKDEDESSYPPELIKWITAFKDVQKDFPLYERLNEPKSKFRVSISYNINVGNCKWYELSRQEFVKKVIEQIEKAKVMAQQAIKYYQVQEHKTIL